MNSAFRLDSIPGNCRHCSVKEVGMVECWKRWRQLGVVGECLMANPIAMVALPLVVSLLGFGHFGKPLKADMGQVWFLVAWIVCSLMTTVLLMYLTSPFWSMFYLRQIQRDYGPKTRARVFAWFDSEPHRAEGPLDIPVFAWKCGEGPRPERQ